MRFFRRPLLVADPTGTGYDAFQATCADARNVPLPNGCHVRHPGAVGRSRNAWSWRRVLVLAVVIGTLTLDAFATLAYGVAIDEGNPDDPGRYHIHEGAIIGGIVTFALLLGVLVVVAAWGRISRDLQDWRAMKAASRA